MTVEKILKIIEERIKHASLMRKDWKDKYTEVSGRSISDPVVISITVCHNRWCAALDELESLKEQIQRES